jgi:hypothetical protein
LSCVQGAIVALPAKVSLPSRRGWAALLPGSLVAFVLAGAVSRAGSANALTYGALVLVPVGAALALGRLARGGRPPIAVAVAPVFALAWLDRSGLAGQAAAVALSALSAVALGSLVGALTPPRWLARGILTMALVDVALVASDLLQRSNNALNAAHPAGGLPRLQSAAFGSALMGYGDLFVAAALGGLLAGGSVRGERLRGAALATVLALAFDMLFLAFAELPATVPIAAALIVVRLRARPPEAGPQGAEGPAAKGAVPPPCPARRPAGT